MTVFQAVALTLVAVGGTAVVLTRDPLRQAIVTGLYGLLMAAVFLSFRAPDPALSEIVVGTIGLPIMILLTLDRVREGGR
jgi:energy-converting hydrogenase B subunit D